MHLFDETKFLRFSDPEQTLAPASEFRFEPAAQAGDCMHYKRHQLGVSGMSRVIGHLRTGTHLIA